MPVIEFSPELDAELREIMPAAVRGPRKAKVRVELAIRQFIDDQLGNGKQAQPAADGAGGSTGSPQAASAGSAQGAAGSAEDVSKGPQAPSAGSGRAA